MLKSHHGTNRGIAWFCLAVGRWEAGIEKIDVEGDLAGVGVARHDRMPCQYRRFVWHNSPKMTFLSAEIVPSSTTICPQHHVPRPW